jgi:lipopolysaccharide biosynthesis glycosyltransferase
MNNIGRIRILSYLILTWLCHYSFPRPIHIVSILDESSRISALIKIHSIVKSAFFVKQLEFHFLVFPSENFTVDVWKSDFQKCNNGVQFNVVEWKQPPLLQVLKRNKFEIDIIFARFYLPHLFPEVPKFIYLDNDLVVNCDLNELMLNPLLIQEFAPPRSSKPTAKVAVMQNPRHSKNPFRTTIQRIALAKYDRTAIVGFVVEQHSVYRAYIESHFNGTHPLVKKTKSMLPHDMFLNAGVFLVDANRWRNENITGLAEAMIIQNAREHLYSTSVGDQGIFYLLFQDKMAILPAQYNMRRLPKKTFYMLEEKKQGDQ